MTTLLKPTLALGPVAITPLSDNRHIFRTPPRIRPARRLARLFGVIFTAATLGQVAIAGKPEWKDNPHSQALEHPHMRVHDQHKHAAGSAKNCPPGLAKKHNGCLPPGQAKRWEKGMVLPSNVSYQVVPPARLDQLHVAPAAPGYQYVMVNNDLLLLQMGTRMVVDAVKSLTR